jgi:azurin
MLKTLRLALLSCAAVTVALPSSGCSPEAPKAPPPAAPDAGAGAGAGAAAEAGAVDVAVEGNDLMKYNLTQFEVKAGQKVRLTLKNVGTMPKVAMGHNLVVLNKGVAALEFSNAITASGKGTVDNGYLPADFKKDVFAHTKLLGPGESDTITFTAPALPGEQEFVCTFPAHATSGMRGKMIVK